MKLFRLGAHLLFAGMVLYAIYSWFSLSPSISPNDVELKGYLTSFTTNVVYNDDEWYQSVIEVSINKNITPELSIDGKYFFRIYPYIGASARLIWYPSKEDDPYKKGYRIGSDSYTSVIAAKKLKELGLINYDSEKELSNVIEGISGFSYIGTSFPSKIKFLLYSPNITIESRDSYLLYCHYEERYGKNLSWVKVVPLNIVSHK